MGIEAAMLKRFMSKISEELTEKKSNLAAVFNFLGGVSGVIALGTIIFFGGAIVQQVKSLDSRVTTIENGGSPTLKAHESLDNQRELNAGIRLKMLEDTVMVFHRMDTKIETVGAKLDALKDQLERHERSTKP